MLKLRIEFLHEEELENILNLIEENYIIFDKSVIKKSNRINSKLKYIYLELDKK